MDNEVSTEARVKESTSVRIARMAKNLGIGFLAAIITGSILRFGVANPRLG